MRKSRFSLLSGACIRQFLLVLAAVCAFILPASAADASHGAVLMHLLRPGTALVADLDGDHIPDIASGIRTIRTPEGYSYQVDLDFSSNAEAKPFSVVSADSTGLKIESVDIDGDHDLDLLVSGRFSPQPIGIWLNDGQGRFTRGDLAKYVLPAWQAGQKLQSPNWSAAVTLYFARRPHIAPASQSLSFDAAHFCQNEIHCPTLSLVQISTGSARFRAPPAPSI
jgi:hypothetical protein